MGRQPGRGPAAIENPATGETIAEVAGGDHRADVDRGRAGRPPGVLRRALVAQDPARALAGAAAPGRPAGRAHGEEFARLESENTGKPYSYVSLGADLPFVDRQPALLCRRRPRHAAVRTPASSWPGYTSMFRREPVGVVGQIAPWNYPLMMAVWKIGPALAAGCTVVLKPAPTTPLTTLLLAELTAGGRYPRGRGQRRHRRQRHRPGPGRASPACAWSA